MAKLSLSAWLQSLFHVDVWTYGPSYSMQSESKQSIEAGFGWQRLPGSFPSHCRSSGSFMLNLYNIICYWSNMVDGLEASLLVGFALTCNCILIIKTFLQLSLALTTELSGQNKQTDSYIMTCSLTPRIWCKGPVLSDRFPMLSILL